MRKKKPIKKPTKQASKAKRKAGQPSKINKIDLSQVTRLAELHLTDKEIAKALNISVATLTNYKRDYPQFLASLKKGKAVTDKKVVLSLFKRAMGYSHPDVHISNFQGEVTVTPIIKHYPPDPTSMIFWLKNRDPENWRDRKEITGADGDPLIVNVKWK